MPNLYRNSLVFALFAILLYAVRPIMSEAAVSLVQVKAVENGSGVTAGLNVSSTSAGDAMICGVTWYANVSVTSFIDNMGDVYASGTVASTTAGPTYSQIWYAANIRSGVTNVTTTWSGGNNDDGIYCHEVSGIATTNPVDVQSVGSSANGTVTALSVATTTTTNANDYIFGVTETNNEATILASGGFTMKSSFSDGLENGASLDKIATSTIQVSNVASCGAAGGYATAMMAFKATDTTPPTVAWTAPANNGVISSVATLTASSTDNVAVAKVAFFAGTFGSSLASSTLIGSSTIPSGTLYSVTWDTSSTSNGSSTLWALAFDSAGNTTMASTTANVENAPLISGAATGSTVTTATITWTTRFSATSQINYGGSASYGSSFATSTLVTSHSLTLTNLLASTTYHYQILSTDGQGNTATSTDGTFTTLSLPIISSFSASPATVTSTGTSTLSWNIVNASSVAITPDSFSTSTLVGSVIVSPTSTTIYTITATNANGTATSTTTVTVNAPAPPAPPAPPDPTPTSGPSVSVAGGFGFSGFVSVAMQSPTRNTVVAGVIPLAGTTSDNAQVSQFLFMVDGSQVGDALVMPPYVSSLDTATLTPGVHTLVAYAKNIFGNTAVSSEVVFTVGSALAQATSSHPAASLPASDPSFVFNRNLALGSRGADVQMLQIFLNNHGFSVATRGPGSLNHETTMFGLLTEQALQAFQKANDIVSAGTPYTTGYGAFGPMTRKKVNGI